MPPEAAFTLGLMLGVATLLLVQAFARRKVRQALAAVHPDVLRKAAAHSAEEQRRSTELEALRQRVAVLERITIDPAVRTAREIEQLRLQA